VRSRGVVFALMIRRSSVTASRDRDTSDAGGFQGMQETGNGTAFTHASLQTLEPNDDDIHMALTLIW
jgi:hypothetical protein